AGYKYQRVDGVTQRNKSGRSLSTARLNNVKAEKKAIPHQIRRRALSPAQWFWGAIAAVCFAATVHAAIVLLFRLVPLPIAAFRQGYDFSFIPSLSLRCDGA